MFSVLRGPLHSSPCRVFLPDSLCLHCTPTANILPTPLHFKPPGCAAKINSASSKESVLSTIAVAPDLSFLGFRSHVAFSTEARREAEHPRSGLSTSLCPSLLGITSLGPQHTMLDVGPHRRYSERTGSTECHLCLAAFLSVSSLLP